MSEVWRTRKALRYHAGRLAVLPGLLPDVVHMLADPHQWHRVRTRQRSLLRRLVRSEVLDKRLAAVVAACPPFGIDGFKPRWACRRPWLCPSCWARLYVLRRFIDVEFALYGGLHQRVPQCQVLPFVAAVACTEALPAGERLDEWSDVLADGMARALQIAASSERRREVLASGADGAYVLHSLAIEHERLWLLRCGLLLGPTLRPFRHAAIVQAVPRPQEEWTRTELAKAFAVIAPFPVSLWHPGLLAVVLPRLRGVRWAAAYGRLRRRGTSFDALPPPRS